MSFDEGALFYGQLPLLFLPGNFAYGHTSLQYDHQGTFAVGYDLVEDETRDVEEDWAWPV